MQLLRQPEDLQPLGDPLLRDPEPLGDPLLRQPRRPEPRVAARLLHRIQILPGQVLGQRELQATGAIVDLDDIDRHLGLPGLLGRQPAALARDEPQLVALARRGDQ